MAVKKKQPYGTKGVKRERIKVKSRTGSVHEYTCILFSHNTSSSSYYTANYETGMSWNGGEGKVFGGKHSTKAEAQKAFTQMKKKLRADGHPFRG